jgi:gluconokinase
VAEEVLHSESLNEPGVNGLSIIVLMGVSGSGKTTVGRLLAQGLGWRFVDGDDCHPRDNVEKMRQGIPLTDQDRWPWLNALRDQIAGMIGVGESAVVACSALKKEYRNRLRGNSDQVRFVHLRGSYDLVEERMRERRGHFFRADLLRSQFEVLEESDAIPQVDISRDPKSVVAAVREAVGL